MKKKIGIYKITSPTGRVYIGQSIDIEKRFKIHQGLYGTKSTKLERSFLKYGVENHKFKIIEECSYKDLNLKEEYWINYYNSIREGLNIELGCNAKLMSTHTRSLISIKK